jgi:Holliday junction DNA helicase RuvB
VAALAAEERVDLPRLVSGLADVEDAGFERSLRPRSFADFVGQERLKENLGVYIAAAKKRGEPLDHVLLSGGPGLGKTTLAAIMAAELGADIRSTSGPALERAGDLVGILTNLKAGDVLFIDEIHRLPAAVEEYLYSAMEDYKVDIVIDQGPAARSVRMDLKAFTLIGATTREGLLSSPMRARFGILQKIDFYPAAEITQVIERSAGLLHVPITAEAARLLAERSRGTPRTANRLLRRVRDLATVRATGSRATGSRAEGPGAAGSGAEGPGATGPGAEGSGAEGAIGMEVARAGLSMLGIDERGLDEMDRKILTTILRHGGEPVGLKTISASVGEEEDTIVEVYEPYLIQQGFLRKTARGRLASPEAHKHLGLDARSEGRLF